MKEYHAGERLKGSGREDIGHCSYGLGDEFMGVFYG